jgi:hypothetical protein
MWRQLLDRCGGVRLGKDKDYPIQKRFNPESWSPFNDPIVVPAAGDIPLLNPPGYQHEIWDAASV